MHRDHIVFMESIRHKKKIRVTSVGGVGVRANTKVCGPLFYIPAQDKDNHAHYFLWDSRGSRRGDIFWLTPEQIVSMESTQEPFESAGLNLVDEEQLEKLNQAGEQ